MNDLTNTAPARIEPRHDADGHPLELDPPCGGNWLRDADGGLRPADESTAAAAGLAWHDDQVDGADHDA